MFSKLPIVSLRSRVWLYFGRALLTGLMLLGLHAVGQAQPTPNGLVLWLKAGEGVVSDQDGFVTDWADASGNLNDAAQHEPGLGPLLVANAVNGQAALRFDGVDDYLEIANSLVLQAGTGDWTVFFVAKRLGSSQGDFPQVIGSRPWVTGLDKGWAVSFDGAGRVCSHYADGVAGHDVPDVRSIQTLSTAAFQMWQVEENRGAGTTAFYANGDADRIVTTGLPLGPIDQPDPIRIGREIGGANNRRANMDLAEVLVYNRVLDRTERDAVAAYLSGKYGLGFTPNQAPTVSVSSPANGANLVVPATFTFSANASDPEGRIRQVDFLVGGQVVGTATQPPFSVPVKVLTPGTVELTAAVTDDRGERVVSAPVTINVTGGGAPTLTVNDGLRLWLAADLGVAVGGDGLVTDWADQSSNVNDAAQHDPASAPLLVDGAVNGKPALRYDGVDDYMEIANSVALQPLDGDWTVFFVAQRRPGSQGDFPQVIGSRPWVAGLDEGWAVSMDTAGLVCSHYADGSAGHDVPAVRSISALSQASFQVWQVEENRTAGLTRFFAGGGLDRSVATAMPPDVIDQTDPIRIGREIGGANNRRASMDLAEVLIYSRALGDADREAVTFYLSGKYGLPYLQSLNVPPTVTLLTPADRDVFVVPTNITLTASANDADGSIASVQFFRGATLIGTDTSSPYSLMVSNGSPGTIAYTAVALDNLGAATRSATVTITNLSLNPPIPAPIDTTGGLFSVVDYEDTFTVGTAARPDGLYNNNASSGYVVEAGPGNPISTWLPFSNFSFNAGEVSTCCGYPGNGANAGAGAGVAQSGGGDFSIAYGLRASYVVSVDAILPPDRLDIGSWATPGAQLGAGNSINVFFRKDGGGLPGIGLYNGSLETDTGVDTGITDSDWHNYAVHSDKANNHLGLFVDGVLKTNLDLTTFADGAYVDYGNAAVGLGGTFVFWADNFKVGAPNRRLRSIDFRDTFTVGTAARPDGLYNNNASGGYNLESDITRTWLPFANFSFNSGNGTTCCGYPGNTGNDGAASGLAQSGGGDFSFEYGNRQSYVVEVDAILPADRFDIGSWGAAGGQLGAGNSLNVFFRKDGGAAPGIGLYNGSTETDTGIDTGVADSNWHRYAAHFDRPNQRLGLYVDGVPKGNLDLATFANGIYAAYGNAAVGIGGTSVFWADNFQVGPPEGELAGPRLVLTHSQGNVTASWIGSGVLQEANDLVGDWTDLPNARSPYTAATGGGAKFYRLRR